MINFGSTDLKIKRTLIQDSKKKKTIQEILFDFEWRISNWNPASSFELEMKRGE